MSNSLRSLISAAVVAACAPMAAHADVITLSFDDAGLGSFDSGGNFVPAQIGGFYNQNGAFGHTVFSPNSGAVQDSFSVHNHALSKGNVNCVPDPDTGDCPQADDVVMTVLDHFNWVRFIYSSQAANNGGTNPTAYVISADGTKSSAKILGGNSSNGFGSWSDWVQFDANDFGGAGAKLVFTGVDGTFLIDDITFDTVGTTPTVPEPATAALVALALAGVVSTRRRKR